MEALCQQSAIQIGQDVAFYCETGTQLLSGKNLLQEWNQIFREILDWLSNPSLIKNEDGEPPSKMTIRTAWTLALRLRNERREAPIAVVPDGDGGISFEWRNGTESRCIEVFPGGQIEEILIRNGRLMYRELLELTPRD